MEIIYTGSEEIKKFGITGLPISKLARINKATSNF
jgi:hypothetical protein